MIQMQFIYGSSTNAYCWLPYMPYDVNIDDSITGHKNVYVNNCWQNRVKAMCGVSLRLSYHYATTDMQHNIPGSSGQVIWPYHRSNFQTEPDHRLTIIIGVFGRVSYEANLHPLARIFQYHIHSMPQPCLYQQSPKPRRWGGSHDRAATGIEPAVCKSQEERPAPRTTRPSAPPPNYGLNF